MASVIGTKENYQGRLAEQMGLSLGQGIGNGLNTFFANRSLDSVLQDKALENAPRSKKLEAMRSALSPYGEKGQEILQQRMQIEQLEMQEAETKKQEAIQKKKGKALGKYLNGGDLTPDEQELFTPKEFVDMHKARNPKPTGGTTSQPIPKDINQKMSYIISQSQDLSSDELKNAFDTAGIPPIYSNPYIENRRRQQETASEHDIKFHQESADFEKSVNTHANTAKRQLPLIENGIKSVTEGKINPGSLANVFNYFGEAGKKIGNALLSKDEAALLASVPEFLEGRKELFGVRLSDADLEILQDKLPDIGKSKEANLAILDLMKRAAERAIRLQKVSEDVLEKKGRSYRGGKLRPLGYEREVIKAFDEQDEQSYVAQTKGKTFQALPSASDHKGKVATDKSNGKRYKSDGTKWVEIK
jgi:hypothetical protein